MHGRDEDILTRDPLNVETSWVGLRSERTPTSEFYTRNNNPIPRIDPRDWRLELAAFEREMSLTLDAVKALPSHSMDVVLECAGNGRTFFDPLPEGTPWRERAVACARFRGARLRDVLERAGVPGDTVEVVFLGADQGKVPFERSLPLDAALHEDTLIAYEMNDAPLEPKHGAPLRLLVPGWYGVASVKWLARIRASTTPFVGHYQTERYVYQAAKGAPATPVREKRVNSIVAEPVPGATVRAGAPLRVRGWAWSGAAEIARVDVSLDGGASWRAAELGPPPQRHAWRAWSLTSTPVAGEAVILARARDAAGNSQPDKPEWNLHGYGYHAPRPRVISAVADLPAPVDGAEAKSNRE